MAKKKAKWLEEGTNVDLLVLLDEIISDEDGDMKKGKKIVAELLERMPDEGEELSIEAAIEALEAAVATGIENIKAAYEVEVENITGAEEDEEDEEDEEEVKPIKGKKDKKGKKAAPPEDEDEDDEDDDEPDYTSMSIKALKTECRDRGIKVKKTMEKADLIKALEADDKE